MSLSNLQEFIEKNEIPIIVKKPKTFLEIAKQPHYENVISNIYAFFFNVHEEHGLEDLFIKSLLECIHEAKSINKDFSSFVDFEIETEYSTIGNRKKKGRIDLLLYNNTQAIIIENKIYHHLDNDLDDYWNSVKLNSEDEGSKIGIILSLKPVSKNNYEQYDSKHEYINLTHAHLMRKVMDNSASFLQDNESKHVHFFHDFHQNIMNISSPTMNEDDINFYLVNKEKVNQLVSFKQQFKEHVIAEVDKAGYGINHVKLMLPKNKFNARRLRYYESTRHSELVYTIVFEELFDERGFLHIIIEPRGNALKNGAIFKNIIFEEQEKQFIKESFYNNTNAAWAHFASNHYRLNQGDIAELCSFIELKIKNEFQTIFNKMEKCLEENKVP